MNRWLSSTALSFSLLASLAQGSSLTVSNSKGFDSNPCVDCSGVLLTGADPVIVALGTFASAPASALPAAGQTVASHSYAQLLAEFTPYGAPTTLIQSAPPLNLRGVFSIQDNVLVAGTPLAGKPVYVIIACGATLATASQVAILKTDARFEAADDDNPEPKLVGVGTTLGTVTIVGSASRFAAAATPLAPLPHAAYSLAEVVPSPVMVLEQPTGTPLNDDYTTTDFGIVAAGATSERTFTIRNVGSTDLHLTGTPVVGIDGPGAACFSVLDAPLSPLPPNGETTFTVRFSPTLSGPALAALHLSNDSSDSQFDLNLTGVRGTTLTALFTSDTHVPLTLNGLDARGLTLNFGLAFAPARGTRLTLINNLGANPLGGTLDNLADGGLIGANYQGRTYYFTADYTGGDGNDLTLIQWNPATTSILVSDATSGAVLRYDLATATRKTFIPAAAFNGTPQGMALSPDGKLCVVDTDFTRASSRILKFDALSGASLGTLVAANAGLNRGGFLAFDADGNIYVQQQRAPLLVKFQPDGAPTGTTFDSGTALIATGLGLGPDGRVYLATGDGDSGLADLIRFRTDGTYVDTFVNDLGNFNGHRKPVWDTLGHLYAANFNDRQVRKFDATSGQLLATLEPPANSCGGLCLLPDGTLLVGDVRDGKIERITADGAALGVFSAGVAATDLILQPAPPIQPEISVAQPVGHELVAGEAEISFGIQVTGDRNEPRVFTIRNDDNAPLTGLTVTVGGPGAASFELNAANFPTTLASDESATFSVTFAAMAEGQQDATLRITSNDSDENPFDIQLTGRALSVTTDSDGDGLNDVTEWKMALLGFDWQRPQPELVATLFANAEGAGLFTRAAVDGARAAGRNEILTQPNAFALFNQAQLQALKPGTPLLTRHPETGKFTLLMHWKKSADLLNFVDFPANPAGVSVTPEGGIQFEFSNPDDAAFFRLEGN